MGMVFFFRLGFGVILVLFISFEVGREGSGSREKLKLRVVRGYFIVFGK